MVEFIEHGTTIISDVYYKTLKVIKQAIQKKCHGLLTFNVVFMHDNARPHNAKKAQEFVKQFKWDVFFHHPSYCFDLAPSDFHLFTHTKK